MGNKTSSVNDVFKDCFSCDEEPDTVPDGIRVLNLPENPERPPENFERPNYNPNNIPTNKNMPVAFSGILPKRLEEGDEICLRGTVAEGATEFTVALVCIDNYTSEMENVAYCHKVNFDDGSSVINHKINGDWQQEDMTDPFEMNRVYVPGEQFSVQLIIKEDDTILVYCNEQFITKHRVPLQVSLQSTHIQIWDGLDRVDSMTVKFA